MKNLLRLGVTASLMAAFVFSGCQKSDDDEPSSKKNRRLLSELCEWTDHDINFQQKTEYKYDARGNEIFRESSNIIDGEVRITSSQETKYDANGEYIGYEYRHFNPDGTFWSQSYEYKYENGRMIECLFKSIWDGEESVSIDKYKYNEQGDKTEHVVSSNKNETDIETWNYQYDEKGNRTEIEYYINGVLSETRKYEYNEKGYMTKGEIYNSNGQLLDKRVFTYDGNTRTVIGENYSSDGNTDGSIVISTSGIEKYTDSDFKHLETEKYTYTLKDGHTSIYETKNTYDSKGTQISYEYKVNGKIREQWSNEGNISTSSSYSYNDDGEIISSNISKTVYTDSNRDKPLTKEQTESGSSGSYNDKYEYSYDNNGNLIGEKRYSDGNLSYENKEYVYDGNKVTYTSYDYRHGEIYRTSYYTLIYDK